MMDEAIEKGIALLPELAANHPVWEHVWHDPIRRQIIIAALKAADVLARKGISKPGEGWKNLIDRLRDDTGCSQGTCLSCTKGFENHEYNCTEGEHCLDSVAVLKRTRKRLRKLALEAADALSASPSQPIEGGERRDVLEARVKELEEALKPFANVANEWGRTHGDAYRFTLMDLRRAQKVIAASPAPLSEGLERINRLEAALGFDLPVSKRTGR